MNAFAAFLSVWAWFFAAFNWGEQVEAQLSSPYHVLHHILEEVTNTEDSQKVVLSALGKGALPAITTIIQPILKSQSSQVGRACTACIATYLCSKIVHGMSELYSTCHKSFTKHLDVLLDKLVSFTSDPVCTEQVDCLKIMLERQTSITAAVNICQTDFHTMTNYQRFRGMVTQTIRPSTPTIDKQKEGRKKDGLGKTISKKRKLSNGQCKTPKGGLPGPDKPIINDNNGHTPTNQQEALDTSCLFTRPAYPEGLHRLMESIELYLVGSESLGAQLQRTRRLLSSPVGREASTQRQGMYGTSVWHDKSFPLHRSMYVHY